MIAVLNMLMRHVPLESTKSVSNVKAAAGRYVGTSCPAPLTTTIMGTHALHPKTLMDFDPGSNPEEANATQNNSKKRTKLKIVSVLRIYASDHQHPDSVRQPLQNCSSTHLRYQPVPCSSINRLGADV
eukprot:COSAG02_NODE_35948_length_461_cov_0.607735_1_plen_127_part_01